jgi:hypothetical protein
MRTACPPKPSPPRPSSPRGRGGRKRLRGERFCESDYLGKSSLGRLQDLLIGEAQHGITKGTEVGLTVLIAGNLRSELVDAAVQLHDELERVAIEIGHIGSDWELATELEAHDLTIAKSLPENLLSRRGLFAKPASANQRTLPGKGHPSIITLRFRVLSSERQRKRVLFLGFVPLSPLGREGLGE